LTSNPEARRGRSRLARELALRLLFQHQVSGALRPLESLTLFERSFAPSHDGEAALEIPPELFDKAWPRAKELFLGTVEHLDDIDRDIDSASRNWALDRMSPVDLALIRLALYEARYREVPPKVCLNEAIEMAKGFGNQDSGAFVNGVLDKLLREARPR
jgi:N utilization substance protein B